MIWIYSWHEIILRNRPVKSWREKQLDRVSHAIDRFLVPLISQNVAFVELSMSGRETASRNEPGGFLFVCPENGNGEICSSSSQKLNGRRIDGRQSKLDACEFIPNCGSISRRTRSAMERMRVSGARRCARKVSVLIAERVPFSLLTVSSPDHNSKYFAETSSNTRGIKHHSTNRFLNLLISSTLSGFKCNSL